MSSNASRASSRVVSTPRVGPVPRERFPPPPPECTCLRQFQRLLPQPTSTRCMGYACSILTRAPRLPPCPPRPGKLPRGLGACSELHTATHHPCRRCCVCSRCTGPCKISLWLAVLLSWGRGGGACVSPSPLKCTPPPRAPSHRGSAHSSILQWDRVHSRPRYQATSLHSRNTHSGAHTHAARWAVSAVPRACSPPGCWMALPGRTKRYFPWTLRPLRPQPPRSRGRGLTSAPVLPGTVTSQAQGTSRRWRRLVRRWTQMEVRVRVRVTAGCMGEWRGERIRRGGEGRLSLCVIEQLHCSLPQSRDKCVNEAHDVLALSMNFSHVPSVG
jgi:hypothetical protein